MSLDYLISILTRQQTRFPLLGETLEDRCQLSAIPLVDITVHTVEVCNSHVFSQIVEASRPLPSSLLVTEVLVDAASTQLAPDVRLSDEAIASDPALEVEAMFDDIPTQPLIAVQPDEGVDPFVDCPGLDPRFCLPTGIDFGFDIDFPDGLIFETQNYLTDIIFDAGHQTSEQDPLLLGDPQFRWQ